MSLSTVLCRIYYYDYLFIVLRNIVANNCCQHVMIKAILETLVLRFVCVLAEVTIMIAML